MLVEEIGSDVTLGDDGGRAAGVELVRWSDVVWGLVGIMLGSHNTNLNENHKLLTIMVHINHWPDLMREDNHSWQRECTHPSDISWSRRQWSCQEVSIVQESWLGATPGTRVTGPQWPDDCSTHLCHVFAVRGQLLLQLWPVDCPTHYTSTEGDTAWGGRQTRH